MGWKGELEVTYWEQVSCLSRGLRLGNYTKTSKENVRFFLSTYQPGLMDIVEDFNWTCLTLSILEHIDYCKNIYRLYFATPGTF